MILSVIMCGGKVAKAKEKEHNIGKKITERKARLVTYLSADQMEIVNKYVWDKYRQKEVDSGTSRSMILRLMELEGYIS